MTERPRDPGEDREDETRNEEGEERKEHAASREAVEEEERTGGPRRQGDG